MKKAYKQIVGITGSSGVLGSFFIKKFKKKFIFKKYNGRIENISELTKWLKRNRKIEIFLHFAALSSIAKSEKNKKKTFLINTNSTLQLLKILKKLKFNKLNYFLFASSSHVYKPSYNKIKENTKRIPANVYGKSKKKVEDFIIKNQKNFLFNIGIARIFNFYDLSQKNGFFIPDIIKKIKTKKRKLKFKKINTNRDYISLDDIANILKFMILKKINIPLNIGSGKKLNLIKLCKMIKFFYNTNLELIFEKRKYPGYVSNITLLRKLGYKNKISSFKFR